MNWKAFIDHLKSLGFEGTGDDFPAVTRWLKINGHDTEVVEGSDGEQIELKGLFDNRAGKPLDVSAAAAKAKMDDEVRRQVNEVLTDYKDVYGKGRPGEPVNPHKHDVKVGKDRLADDPKGGFKHFGEMCFDVIPAGKKEGDGQISERLDMYQKASLSTYGNESTGADGGFAVPPEFRNSIMVSVEGEDSILSRTDRLTIAGNSISIPADETEPWLNTAASGVRTFWSGEASAITQSKPQLVQKDLKLRKLVALVPITEELMEDASALAAYVPRKAGEKLDFAVGESIFRGNGTSQPLGFLNSGSLISVTKESSQGGDTVLGPNIIKMWSRMYAPYRRNAVWFIQQNVEPELMRASLAGRKDSGGQATNWGGLIYVPGGNIAGAPFNTLMGRPVIVTQHCETLGDAGDIVLASMDQYLTVTKGSGVEQASSVHLWFDQDTMALKFRMRIDGQSWRDSTIAGRDTGASTLSAFVTLAART